MYSCDLSMQKIFQAQDDFILTNSISRIRSFSNDSNSNDDLNYLHENLTNEVNISNDNNDESILLSETPISTKNHLNINNVQGNIDDKNVLSLSKQSIQTGLSLQTSGSSFDNISSSDLQVSIVLKKQVISEALFTFVINRHQKMDI